MKREEQAMWTVEARRRFTEFWMRKMKEPKDTWDEKEMSRLYMIDKYISYRFFRNHTVKDFRVISRKEYVSARDRHHRIFG